MEDAATDTTGQTGGKSGQQLAHENEGLILNLIREQGWIRERELAVLARMSEAMIGRTVRRLERAGYLFREKSAELATRPVVRRYHPAQSLQVSDGAERTAACCGFFLRLTNKGEQRVDGSGWKDVKIPHSWRHDALAIHTLGFLSGCVSGDFITEAATRKFAQSGKIPDGWLFDSIGNEYHFEQELSRKTGKKLLAQSLEVMRESKKGRRCYIGYPYPPTHCDKHDHERTQIKALAKLTRGATENIYLVRCIFNNGLDFMALRPSGFQVLSLGEMLKAPLEPVIADVIVETDSDREEALDIAYAKRENFSIHVEETLGERDQRIVRLAAYFDGQEHDFISLHESRGAAERHRCLSFGGLIEDGEGDFDAYISHMKDQFRQSVVRGSRKLDEYMNQET